MLAVDAACDSQEIPVRLLEIIRLCCSVVNQCDYCIELHRGKLAALDVSMATIDALVKQFDSRELAECDQAAIAFALALTRLSDQASIAGMLQKAQIQLSQRQCLMLAFEVAQINSWNRIMRMTTAYLF